MEIRLDFTSKQTMNTIINLVHNLIAFRYREGKIYDEIKMIKKETGDQDDKRVNVKFVNLVYHLSVNLL